MKKNESSAILLSNFEGPLEFLLYLVQKNEIDIYEVFLQEITAQYQQKFGSSVSVDINSGAEFVSSTAFLLWLKSKTLLPKHEQSEALEDIEPDPHFEIIHQLMDYCKFKQAAKDLSQLELKQSLYYPRGQEASPEVKKPLGIEHISLEDLASLFQQVISKASPEPKKISGETWQVSDKIIAIQNLFEHQQKIPFELLFNETMSREELIATFLAVLELMKEGFLKARKESNVVVFVR